MWQILDVAIGAVVAASGRRPGRARWTLPTRTVPASPWLVAAALAVVAIGAYVAITTLVVVRVCILLSNDDLFFVLAALALPVLFAAVLFAAAALVGLGRLVWDLLAGDGRARLPLGLAAMIAGLGGVSVASVGSPWSWWVPLVVPSAVAAAVAIAPAAWRAG